jgi:hypothetical protein
LVLRFVSQPLFGLPSQSPKPPAQTGVQTPETQLVVPLALLQLTPQAPQLAVVLSAVSQPLAALPSQLPNPALHVPSVHVPATQLALALARLHVAPHAPQSVSVLMFRSQPLFGLPSQLAKPAAQFGVQAPLTQDVVPLAFVHCVPQAPQLAVVLSAVSQPLALLASQLPKPALQAPRVQVPVAHEALALARLHVVPHVPQFDKVRRSVSQPLVALPSQLAKLALQVPRVQVPVVHDALALARLHVTPQAPQFESVWMLVSQPLAALLSQLPKPALQVPSWQAPPKHAAEAFEKLHALPHVPQCETLVLVLVSQPLATLLSQLPKPELHAMVQAPPPQPGVPLTDEQAALQAPQCAMLVFVLVSQPLALLASQLPKPTLQVPSVQTPVEHDSAAFAKSQTTPQPLQSVVVRMLVSQPLLGLPSQLPQVVEHVGVQTPPEQVVLPWPASCSQTMPQPPQFEVVVMLVSQPLAALPSQFAKPALQVPSWQVPLLQTALALGKLQALPQAPQCKRLVLRLASQPLPTLASQLPNPTLQEMLHAPSAQDAVPLVPLQALPQLPQLARLVLLLTSQPSA